MNTFEDILELIGKTPLVRLKTGIPEGGPKAYVKLEFLNPSGSVKDRMTAYILKKAISEGRLKPGDTVVDNSSGNTGSSLAMTASVLGLKSIITTPEKTSQEKTDLIRSFGAKVIVTPTEAPHDSPESHYMIARKLCEENGYFDLNQYDNKENIEAHYRTTGPELWHDTDGKITHFVCGIGTGGTLSGTGRYLKEKNPDVRVIAVDPEGSIFAEYVKSGKIIEGELYQLEGIGSDVITGALDKDVIDELISVSDKDSFNRARLVSKTEGISCGGSSGTVACAMEIVARSAKPDSFIVGIFADSGIRYLSKCYNDDWMKEQGFI